MKARLVGINHVALEVGDVEETIDFYGRIFELELRGRAGPGWRSSTSVDATKERERNFDPALVAA